MTKHLHKFLLTAAALLCAVSTHAHDVVVDGIYYNLNTDERTASVTYEEDDGWSATAAYTGVVVIPASITVGGFSYSVTDIGVHAFTYCKYLNQILIPSSVASIGDYAFLGCDGLNFVTVPSPVTSIGMGAFQHCENLNYISLPSSLTSIGAGALLGCSKLTNIDMSADNAVYSSEDGVLYDKNKTTLYICPGGKKGDFTIPASVTNVAASAFACCAGLTSVTIPSSVVSIGAFAFEYCLGLISVAVPPSVTSIGNNVFEECRNLTSVTIPSSVTSIGDEAFLNCLSLTSVTIFGGVQSLGARAFEYCSGLTSVTIPSSVTSIGERAFSNCAGLTAIEVSPENAMYCSEDGVLYDKGKTTLYVCPMGKTGSFAIASSVSRIERSAFQDCHLTSIMIPESVTSIGTCAFLCTFSSMYSFNPVPPVAEEYCFYYSYDDVTLYVPEGSVEEYRNAAEWKKFKNIEEFDATGINDVKANRDRKHVWYDLNGRRLTAPQKGLNIINGRKVMV